MDLPCRIYGYVRSRQLDSNYSKDPSLGVWQSTSLRVSKGWGSPPENAWPYEENSKKWPPKEPKGLDELAKKEELAAIN